jgi:exodeoxyribonuclease VII large subunit
MPPEKNHIRLSELNNRLKGLIQDTFYENIWIIAEIGDIKFNRNGHAYLELIEKDQVSDKIIAKATATIWSYTLRMVKPYFETTTGRELTSGLKILVAVAVEFHELYGFSLNIRDIDPAYTLGDIALQRMEIINRLKDEGIMDMNKELELPVVIQNIAIISSETAAGYQDFIIQLKNNPYGYKFNCKLFTALMQGEKTETSIIAALEAIYEHEGIFDAVVIIRGGGSRSDLLWFDNYNLCYFITQFPIPVISGIGHDKDISVVDLVSHTSLKTPTAAAEFILANNSDFENILNGFHEHILELCSSFLRNEYERVQSLANILIPLAQKKLHRESTRINLNAQKITLLARNAVEQKKRKFDDLNLKLHKASKLSIKWELKLLNQLIYKMQSAIAFTIKNEQKKLEYIEGAVSHFDPANVLKKGYSITKSNGKCITNASLLETGEMVETILYQGKFTSIVDKKL